jgi:hypothetical protein
VGKGWAERKEYRERKEIKSTTSNCRKTLKNPLAKLL